MMVVSASVFCAAGFLGRHPFLVSNSATVRFISVVLYAGAAFNPAKLFRDPEPMGHGKIPGISAGALAEHRAPIPSARAIAPTP